MLWNNRFSIIYKKDFASVLLLFRSFFLGSKLNTRCDRNNDTSKNSHIVYMFMVTPALGKGTNI